jgi:hypothetical protein
LIGNLSELTDARKHAYKMAFRRIASEEEALVDPATVDAPVGIDLTEVRRLGLAHDAKGRQGPLAGCVGRYYATERYKRPGVDVG